MRVPSSQMSSAQLDVVVQKVHAGAKAFAQLKISERIALAEQIRQDYRAIAEESAIAACKAKGIDPDSQLAGEEWISGPMVTLRILRQTVESLKDIQKSGVPTIKRSWLRTLPDGRLAVKVYPLDTFDALLLAKHEGEVYLRPGITAENLSEHQASFYKKPHQGRVCAVLGGGNVNAIPPTDVIQKMFVEGTVCILKMNPVNEYLGPFMERAFRSAIDKGFFAVVYGGAEEGAALVEHPAVDEIHITGSDKTFDAMVWGSGPEGAARKQRNEPVLKKAISSELGNITPVIVVPGPYTPAELAYQASNVAGMVAHNASFNCNAAKLLVTPKSWEQRQPLVEAIAQRLGQVPTRKAYYPGAQERWKKFTDGRPGLRVIGDAKEGELPYALIPNVDPTNANDPLFHQEPWCSVISETPIAAADPVVYLEQAVRFLNDTVWGTLCATIIVHPHTLKDPRMGPAVEKAINQLQYGSICLNTWAGAVFGLGSTPWGSHPGTTPQDIQSGSGWVHNTKMLEGVEKVVLRAPVKSFPNPPWFPGHRSLNALAKRLVDFETEPGWLKIPGLSRTAMKA